MGKRTLFDSVKEDLDKRNALGFSIHGKDLFHTNSNNFIREAYEEALDLAVYLKGALLRIKDKRYGYIKKYRVTAKGKACCHRYNTSEKGRATVRRYTRTPKGKEKHLKYSRSAKRLERAKWQIKSYRTRDRIKNLL